MQDNDFNISQGLSFKKVPLSDLADLIGGEVYGDNVDIYFLTRLKSRKSEGLPHLTYITNEAYLNLFLTSPHEAAIISKNLFHLINSANYNKSFLLVDGNAETAFFELYELLYQKGYYSKIPSYRGINCEIHNSAVISDNVIIKNNVIIHPNVVIFPNSIIDDDVEIKPGTVIGGAGFERKILFGKTSLVSHSGGVYLGKNVSVGSSVSIDRGEMGEFTQIHDNTKIDNLVHVAHNVIIGAESFIIAGSEISGSSVFGKGIWYAPNSCCNPEIILGDYTFVGTGSVVVKNTPPFALVYGNPAKQFGWMCKCQKHRLVFKENHAQCECGRKYEGNTEKIALIEDI